LLDILDNTAHALNEGSGVDAVYKLYFQGALDMVSFQRYYLQTKEYCSHLIGYILAHPIQFMQTKMAHIIIRKLINRSNT